MDSLPSPQAPPAHLVSGQWVSWGAQRTDWGFCPVGLQNPYHGHALALGQAVRQQGTSPPSASQRPESSYWASAWIAVCATFSCLPFTWPEEPEGQLGPGRLAPSAVTTGQGAGSEGAASWALSPLSQDLDLRRKKSCLETLPFLVRTENHIPLVEIYRNSIAWPWHDLKNKGFDPRSLQWLTKPLLPLS